MPKGALSHEPRPLPCPGHLPRPHPLCLDHRRLRPRPRPLGIKAPAVTGHPAFERALRVQQNTVEQLLLFLPSLWIFALTLSPRWAGIIGLVFVAARLLYIVSYARNPAARGPGFTIGFVATLMLLLGALAGTLKLLLAGLA